MAKARLSLKKRRSKGKKGKRGKKSSGSLYTPWKASMKEKGKLDKPTAKRPTSRGGVVEQSKKPKAPKGGGPNIVGQVPVNQVKKGKP